jgi:transketolase
MRDAFVANLLNEAEKNPNIILISGDLGFGVLDAFRSKLPKQFINSGVNEQSMMSMAAGIASTGKRVFVYSIGNFPTLRCIEQIRNDVCLMNNPVVVVSVGAGYSYGSMGYTHHALEDIAILRALPNMKVFSPADAIETEIITQYLAETLQPSYLRLGKSNEPILHSAKPEMNYGHFSLLKEGNCASILFTGSVGEIAIEAARLLSLAKRQVAVYSVPYISDIDSKELKEISKKGKIVVLEEHSERGGLASAILETAARNSIEIKLISIAATQHNLSEVGSQYHLRKTNGIHTQAILEALSTP